jgi:hypothetical protein
MTEPVLLNPSGLLESYGVELLCEAPVVLASQVLQRRLAEALEHAARGELRLAGGAIPRSAADAADSLTFQYRGDVRDAGEPPSWRLSAPPSGQNHASTDEALHDAIAQSWWWDEAAARAHASPHRLLLADHRFLTLDYQRRLVSFRKVLSAVLQCVATRAVHWLPSQQLVDPEEIVAAHRADPEGPLPGGLNVRFYRVDPRDTESGDEEYVMDTLGLGALGLIDLQCHFRGLDPDAVGEVLLRTGCYLFERGLVVRAGDSVQGPGPQDRWLARQSVALSPPEREVLELDPGYPFSAGIGEAGTEEA